MLHESYDFSYHLSNDDDIVFFRIQKKNPTGIRIPTVDNVVRKRPWLY